MRRTLLLIPHELGGLPVFGFGWLLMALAVAISIRLAIAFFATSRQSTAAASPTGQARRGGWRACLAVATHEGVYWGIAALVIAVGLPRVELHNAQGDPIGIAIRGYGFMLLLGVGTAVYAAAYRAARAGLGSDVIYSLAPWTFIGGIVGARTFYVIQYWDDYSAATLSATLANVLAFTGGGLVVYGGLIGGFLSSAFFVIRHRLPLLELGDVIVPCIFIGLMFGRVGCLMNGCCYGGRCEAGPMAIEFPPASPVYVDQIRSGELIGMTLDDDGIVTSIRPQSLADQAGITPGSRVDQIQMDDSFPQSRRPDVPADSVAYGVAASVDGRVYRWSPAQLPQRSLPVRAAQWIASISAGLIAVTLWIVGRFMKRSGILLAGGFATYAVGRFILEWIRVDEAGQFGTELSISQWVSMAVLAVSSIVLIWLLLRPSSHGRGPGSPANPGPGGPGPGGPANSDRLLPRTPR